jgi:hypothetical protein
MPVRRQQQSGSDLELTACTTLANNHSHRFPETSAVRWIKFAALASFNLVAVRAICNL